MQFDAVVSILVNYDAIWYNCLNFSLITENLRKKWGSCTPDEKLLFRLRAKHDSRSIKFCVKLNFFPCKNNLMMGSSVSPMSNSEPTNFFLWIFVMIFFSTGKLKKKLFWTKKKIGPIQLNKYKTKSTKIQSVVKF